MTERSSKLERTLRAEIVKALVKLKLEDGDILIVKEPAVAQQLALLQHLPEELQRSLVVIFAPLGIEKVTVQFLRDLLAKLEPDESRIIMPQ